MIKPGTIRLPALMLQLGIEWSDTKGGVAKRLNLQIPKLQYESPATAPTSPSPSLANHTPQKLTAHALSAAATELHWTSGYVLGERSRMILGCMAS